MKCGAQIECVNPDGQLGQVARMPAEEPGASALIMEDDTVTCLLQAGDTNFVIELPPTASLDRFTFLNENGLAKGELRISVSNHRLPAASPDWVPVEGVIPFEHKRLFGVSLLGIEAKFVRLSFHVEKAEHVSARAHFDESADDRRISARETAAMLDSFKISALDNAITSKFANRHAREPIDVSGDALSVGPLSPLPH